MDIALQLIRNTDVELYVITIDSGEYIETYRKAGISTIDLAEKGLVNPKIYFKLKKVLRELKPDIVHTHLHKADFYGRLAAKSIGINKIFSTCHNYSTKHSGADINKLSLFDRIDNVVVHFTGSRLIAISDIVRKYLTNRSANFSSVTETIYNGVDVERRLIPKLSRDQILKLRSELGFSLEDMIILIMGRLEMQKGHLFFLESIKDLLKTSGNLKVLILGEGSLIQRISEYIDAEGITGKVKLAGFLPDSEPYTEIADIVAVPSHWEAFGLVAIEGMIKGKIVLASDVGGLAEVITNNKDGFLYRNNDASDLRTKLETILSDYPNLGHIKSAAINTVKERFDIKNTALKYYESYIRATSFH
jgi:glycosyltransferase involved in cell wall biosynthesis